MVVVVGKFGFSRGLVVRVLVVRVLVVVVRLNVVRVLAGLILSSSRAVAMEVVPRAPSEMLVEAASDVVAGTLEVAMPAVLTEDSNREVLEVLEDALRELDVEDIVAALAGAVE